VAKSLIEFLTDLSTDSDLLEAFKKDRTGTMKSNGISDSDIELVICEKYDEIKKLLGDDRDITTNHIIQIIKK
jgi:hypothetical protein